MHPLLFRIGDLPITSYGAALALAFAIGTGVAMRRARAADLNAERVLECAMLILVSALLGARLFHVLGNPADFEGMAWIDRLWPFDPETGYTGVVGLSVMGGIPVSLAAAFLYFWFRGDGQGFALMDVMAPSVALGAGITRIGCFLNGCCFGEICHWPWAVGFPPGSLAQATLPGALLHPTQLYQAIAGFVLFGLLVAYARRSPPSGRILAGLCLGMGLARLVVEFVRHHAPHEIALAVGGIELTTYQVTAAGLLLFGCALWLWSGREVAPVATAKRT